MQLTIQAVQNWPVREMDHLMDHLPWITSVVMDSQPTSDSFIQPVDENIEPITKPDFEIRLG